MYNSFFATKGAKHGPFVFSSFCCNQYSVHFSIYTTNSTCCIRSPTTLSHRIQHIFDEDTVTTSGIIHQNMGHGPHQFPILDNRTAAHIQNNTRAGFALHSGPARVSFYSSNNSCSFCIRFLRRHKRYVPQPIKPASAKFKMPNRLAGWPTVVYISRF